MPYYMYVAVQGDNKISVFTIDPDSGGMTLQSDVAVDGGPFTMAISPDRRFLYVGCREITQLVSFEIDQSDGGLTQNGSVPLDAWPVYVATDRRGRFVLSSYYQGARVAVHPIGDDGSVGGDPVVSLETATGAHAMQTDPTNSYAFVPHIAGNGPNSIWQFRFDENTGHITPNSPATVDPEEFLGPRHFCFHPSLDVLYFSNEQGCSVSAYNLDASAGTLSLFPDHNHPAAGRVQRAQHLLADPDHVLGPVPVRAEPGPRQHRLLHHRRCYRRVVVQRHRALGSATQRPVPRPAGQVHLLRGTGLGADGDLRRRGFGRAVPCGDASAGRRAGLDFDHRTAGLTCQTRHPK